MTQPLTLSEFEAVSSAQWDQVILKDLKGVAPKQKLYYTAEDLRGLDYLDAAPGQFPYTRGTRDNNAWRIREVVRNAAEAHAALDSGAEEICFVLGNQNIEQILDTLPFQRCAVHFAAGKRAADIAEALIRRRVRGSVDYEPLGDFDRAARIVSQSRGFAEFRPVMIRADRFAENGATAAQELGLALAEGVEIAAQLTDRGVTPAEAASALVFSFSIGGDYFQEIAKLRAARTLWARAMECFHPQAGDAAKMVILALTAHWTESVYDSHVNLLRSTTEAMAAAIGGADAITVEPFDNTYREPGDFSRRLARNTQLILKKEAWLDRSVDPAGGSYYLEALTDSLASTAWKFLQTVEAAGGFVTYSASGELHRQIADSRTGRETAVSTRRRSIVGTNQYPNPQERMLPEIQRADAGPRPARIFEEIRLRTERYAARTGRTPKLLLLEAGDLKMRQARSGFILNFFACAGFEIEVAEEIAGNPDAVVLCSSDTEYPALAPRVIRELRAAGKSTPVIVAGNPSESIEQLKQAGVADFVHIRSNAAEVLRTWQERLGVGD